MKHKNRSKVFKLLIISILLGILIIFCSKKWYAWFGNPVEPSYSSSEAPVRIQLTPGNEGALSRNVSWQCGDTLAASQLFIVKSTTTDTLTVPAEGKILRTQAGITVTYHSKLTGLPEGKYKYCVSTNGKSSAWYTFNLSVSDHFRFVYIGDIQDKIGGTAGKLFSSISQNEKDAAFWILGGDVVERPHDRYWNEYFTSMDSITETTPVIACPGNHEYRKGLIGKLDERFIDTFSYLIDSQNNGNAVFDTRYGNTAIITLDSNRDTWTLFSQRRWLKQALIKAQDAKWKIVVLHHPLYSVRGKFRHYLIRHLFDPLIREYGVDMVLQGHEHCYARMINKEKNNTFSTPVYLISHASPKDYEISYPNIYDRFGNGLRFYQIVEISSDTLMFKSYTETGELYDQLRIVKTNDNLQVTDMATDIPEHFVKNSQRM